jgi:hypothetical protein
MSVGGGIWCTCFGFWGRFLVIVIGVVLVAIVWMVIVIGIVKRFAICVV